MILIKKYPYTFGYTIMKYICIEGNIGAGKTTLVKLLAQRLHATSLFEKFEDNPFLPIFYKDPARYAFPVELHFLMERHRQLKRYLIDSDLFSSVILADYCPQKSLIFARETLEEREFRLFKGLFSELLQYIPKPDTIFFINRDREWLRQSIQSRGRSYEMDMDDAYLSKVQQSYLSTFKTLQEQSVIWINAGGINFLEDQKSLERLSSMLLSSYNKGIQFVDFQKEAI